MDLPKSRITESIKLVINGKLISESLGTQGLQNKKIKEGKNESFRHMQSRRF